MKHLGWTPLFFLLLTSRLAIPTSTASEKPATPLEASNYTALTSHAAMMEYLDRLDRKSNLVHIERIGSSVEGRPISALFFSKDKNFGSHRGSKPVVMIFCQQHGDEPSGKEAAIVIASRLVQSESCLLKKMDLILIPQVNPDGAERDRRRNANDRDLNRNHVIFSEPEAFAIHALFLDWMPEVTLDVHEYNAISERWVDAGFIKDADEMLGGVTNLNIDDRIIDFTRRIFIPETGAGIEADGYSFHRYIVGSPFDDGRLRFSTTSINDGRQSLGIYNTLSFILEGKRYGDTVNLIERRTRGQVSAILNFLRTVDRHAEDILALVGDARKRLANAAVNNDAVALQMDYFADSTRPALSFPVFDLKTWRHATREFDCFEPDVKVKLSVPLPEAYCIPSDNDKLIDLLKKHRMPFHRMSTDQETMVGTYTIHHVTPSVEEDYPSLMVDARLQIHKETLPAGQLILKLNHGAALLAALLLEPQSSVGFLSERGGRHLQIKEYLRPGLQYPIKRLPSLDGLMLEPVEHF